MGKLDIVRVWGLTDPRFLNRKHLLAEHREVHVLSKRENGPGPEWDRFWSDGHGVSALLFRHELLRLAMNARWPGRHTRSQHETPVLFTMMLPVHKEQLVVYAQWCKKQATILDDEAVIIQNRFAKRMLRIKFPPCKLEGYADTPWHRDGMTFLEYVEIGDDWDRKRYHHKHKEWKSGHRT